MEAGALAFLRLTQKYVFLYHDHVWSFWVSALITLPTLPSDEYESEAIGFSSFPFCTTHFCRIRDGGGRAGAPHDNF